jgi:hypothetical protein
MARRGKFFERQAAEREEQRLDSEAEAYWIDRVRRHTLGTPSLDDIIASANQWKYGGTFEMGRAEDGEHHRITIRPLGRVIHLHLRDFGRTLSRAHVKSKIKELTAFPSFGDAEEAITRGFIMRPGQSLPPTGKKVEVGPPIAKRVSDQRRRDKLKIYYDGMQSADLHKIAEYDHRLYEASASFNGWGGGSQGERANRREIVRLMLEKFSDSLSFRLPDA